MEVSECIRQDHATRAFNDEPVSENEIISVIELARQSGSGKNRQPWSFIIVQDPDRLDELAEFGEYTTPLRRAPVGIVLLADNLKSSEKTSAFFDCGRVFQNMKLAATDRGLGSVPQSIDGKQAENFLNVPETKSVVIALALGYPAGDDDTIEGKDKEEVLENMDREDLNELVYWERYQ